MPAVSELTGRQKAAALLIALGPEISSQVLKGFADNHVEKLAVEILRMNRISENETVEVLQEFCDVAGSRQDVVFGGASYVRQLLDRALGSEKADELIGRTVALRRQYPFEFLRGTDPVQLVNFIQNEHPQTIALVLAHLPPSQTANILSGLGRDLQSDVAMRIASMDRTAPDVIREVERVLKKKLSVVVSEDYSSVGGVEFLVRVLNKSDRGTEKTILESLEHDRPELAEEVKKLMFIFDDIVKLDDRSLQRVLREVATDDLALALKGASEQLRERIFANMSTRAAETLREEMDVSGPVRLRQVEEAQQRIVAVIRRLDEAQEIIISRGGDDIIV